MLIDSEKVKEKLQNEFETSEQVHWTKYGIAEHILELDLSDCAVEVPEKESLIRDLKMPTGHRNLLELAETNKAAVILLESQAAKIERLRKDAEDMQWKIAIDLSKAMNDTVAKCIKQCQEVANNCKCDPVCN